MLILVGLHTFEALQSIVEDRSSGIKSDGRVRVDERLSPAGFRIPIDGEHVIAGVLSKDQIAVGNLRFANLGQLFLQISMLKIQNQMNGELESIRKETQHES